MNGQYRRNELNAAFWSGGWLLGLAFVFSFFVTLLMLTSPVFMLLIYDRVLTSRSQESLVALFGLAVTLFVLMGLFDYSRRRILARFGARLQERLESRVLEAGNAQASPTRLGGTKELDGLRSFLHSSSLVAVLDFIWAPIFLGAVFLFHSLLGWVALTGVALLFALAGLRAAFSSHLAEDSDAASSAVGRMSRHIQESQKTLLAQGMAGSVTEGWLAARKRSRDRSIILNDRVVWFATITKQLRLVFQSMVLALGAYLVLGGQLTVGGMVASVVLLVRVFRPVEHFLSNMPDIRRAMSNWRALDAMLKSAPRRHADDDLSDLGGALEVRDLCIRRPDGKGTLLDGIAFSVEPGEAVQITGGTGSGKSVLARALTGQQAITSGAVTIGGRNIEQFGAEAIGRLVGYLPEDVGFYPGSIADNISRMTPNPRKEDVVAAAKRAGAHRMIEGLPNGYRTVLDADGAPLSKGQRQKIAMARALFGDPRVLVLDEPGLLSAGSGMLRPGGPAVVILGRGIRDLPAGGRHYRLDGGNLVEARPDRPASLPTQRRDSVAPKIVNG
jgi:ATP-binding cassette subfamily C protein